MGNLNAKPRVFKCQGSFNAFIDQQNIVIYNTQEAENLYIPSGDVLVHFKRVVPGITFPRI
jgi:hypothetical protein